jgi:hypothetical protein
VSDVKPENILIKCFTKFGIEPEKDDEVSSIELIGFNSDEAFCSGMFDMKNYSLEDSTEDTHIQAANVLYFLPHMDKPIDTSIKELLMGSRHSPELMVSSWLREMFEQNHKYEKLRNCGFNDGDLSRLNLPIRVAARSACWMYQQLLAIKDLIAMDDDITHSQLLTGLHPAMGTYYAAARRDESPTADRNSIGGLALKRGMALSATRDSSAAGSGGLGKGKSDINQEAYFPMQTASNNKTARSHSSLISGSYDEYDTYANRDSSSVRIRV